MKQELLMSDYELIYQEQNQIVDLAFHMCKT